MSLGVHTTRVAKKLEWFGLTIVKRYLSKSSVIKDVHADPHYFRKGVDLMVERPTSFSIDLKVDSYIGSDRERRIRGMCNPDSGMILLEVISQLQYDRTKADVRGWFFTSEADEVFYYFLALLNDPRDLGILYARYRDAVAAEKSTSDIEDELIRALRVDNDLLIAFNLEKARKWYAEVGSGLPVSWSGASNPTYVTVSRRIPRDAFLEPKGPGRYIGRVYQQISASV